MRVITAIEDYQLKDGEVSVFLAGGITNCFEWQDEVIDILRKREYTDKLVIFNPRRKNFPIGDPTASHDQITWEFKQLEKMDIFSMYFCGGISDQPICMYELGRNIVRMQNRFPADWEERIIVSVEDNYKRKDDVFIQTDLATGKGKNIFLLNSLADRDFLIKCHAGAIYHCYDSIIKKR